MSSPVRIAVTFRLTDELLDAIRAVDPRVEILDLPTPQLGPGARLEGEQLAEACRAMPAADILFGTNQVPMEMLDVATNLKWFQVITAGVDNLAAQGVLERGFTVTNASGLAASAMAEYVIGAMLVLCKGLHHSVRDQAAHSWQFRFVPELAGQVCGIVGLGAIGRETARRARALGMRVVASRRTVGGGEDPDCDTLLPHSELAELLGQSDYVVLAVPLTTETAAMIGRGELAAMKRTAYLVNVARGPVVDEPALIEALRDGTIAGAALDVVDQEPLSADSPLWEMQNVLITPHISGAVAGYAERATALFTANLRRYLRGEVLENIVDANLKY